ncbi:MAG TPA: hypothetical protein VHE33_01975 [Acidobacteriaceae bacterium]|nr:hypothetical protein [Acidobacteriaceae bacterium]
MNTIEEPLTFRPGSRAQDWASLSRIGGIAAFILILYSLAMIGQLLVLGGQPATVAEAFSLLQHHRIVALLRLDLPTVFVLPLYYVLFLGLAAALYRSHPAQVILATSLSFVGITLVLATPTALSLIPLSDKYAAATSDAARNQLLAAGQALMAADIWHATGAILGGILAQCGAVMICVVMLRSPVFTRTTAWLGIVMHSLDLAHIVFALLWPTAGFALMAAAGPLYPIWFFLIGRRLLRLSSAG